MEKACTCLILQMASLLLLFRAILSGATALEEQEVFDGSSDPHHAQKRQKQRMQKLAAEFHYFEGSRDIYGGDGERWSIACLL